MSLTQGRFVWYDLVTTDVSAAASFYKEVIGWEAADSGLTDRTYLLLSSGPIMVGGLMPIPDEAKARGLQPAWMGYIGVDDVDLSAARITAAGGAIQRGPEDIPGVGRFAVVSDPQGASFVIIKGNLEDPPAPIAPGTPGHVGWRELHAGDLATAWPFYESLFGFTRAGEVDMGPMGLYQMFATGGEASPAGGMMTRTPETPAPFWLYYFNVEAVDAAVGRATKAGAKLLVEPHEVPGGQWIAQFLDPQGALFAVVAFHR